MKHLFKKTTLILALATSFGLNFVSAKMPYTQLKGIYTATTPEFSPLNGFVGFESGLMESAYRLGDPKQPVIQLIGQLFYLQHDEITFGATTRFSKPATHFTPETIGRILGFLAWRKDQIGNGKAEQLGVATVDGATSDLLGIVREDIDFDAHLKDGQARVANIYGAAPEAFGKVKQLQGQIEQLKQEKVEIQATLTELSNKDKLSKDEKAHQEKLIVERKEKETALNPLKRELKGLLKNSSTKALMRKVERAANQVNLQKNDLRALLRLVIEAQEAQIKGEPYGLLCLETILLCFMWDRIEKDKSELAPYFRALEESYPDAVHYDQKEAYLGSEEVFTDENAQTFKAALNEEAFMKQAEFLLEQFESALLSTYPLYENLVVKSRSDVTFVDSAAEEHSFADCGTTSLRNLCNLLLANLKTGHFDIGRLMTQANADDSSLAPSEKLISFYRTHSLFTQAQAKPTYDAFAQVVSGLEGVAYITDDVCELDAGLSNMLRVVSHVLFGNSEAFNQRSNSGKLDFLCQELSHMHPDFELSWQCDDDINEKDTGITIQFMKEEDKPWFTWTFDTTHFVVELTEDESFALGCEELLRKALLDAPSLNQKNMLGLLMPWVVKPLSSKLIRHLKSNNPNEKAVVLPSLLRLRCMQTSEGRLTCLKKLLKANILPREEYLTFLKQLMASVHQNMLPLIFLAIKKKLIPDPEDFVAVLKQKIRNLRSGEAKQSLAVLTKVTGIEKSPLACLLPSLMAHLNAPDKAEAIISLIRTCQKKSHSLKNEKILDLIFQSLEYLEQSSMDKVMVSMKRTLSSHTIKSNPRLMKFLRILLPGIILPSNIIKYVDLVKNNVELLDEDHKQLLSEKVNMLEKPWKRCLVYVSKLPGFLKETCAS